MRVHQNAVGSPLVSAMRKLLLAFLFLPLYGLAVTAPGCGNVCNDLRDVCSRCTDADYQASCNQTVDDQDQGVCSAQRSTFEQFCPELGGGGAGGGTDTSGDCRSDEVLCAGTCVNLDASPSACGDCNTTCAEGQVCGAGRCLDACPNGLPDACDGGCVDLDGDPRNCGACGTVCAEGEVCADGACATECSADSANATQCGSSCVNPSNDPLNCGGCGTTCAAGEVCSQGACGSECGAGLTQCCGRCVDITSDPEHCNGCDPSCPEVDFANGSGCGGAGGAGGAGTTPSGVVCADGEVCNAGCCAGDCGTLTQCPGGVCVDTDSDASHCGGCNQLCAGGVCAGGACSNGGCPDGFTECNGGCYDLTTSTTHCGACENACGAGQVCSLGSCSVACNVGLAACNGGCVDINSDPDNCGASCTDCSGSTPKCSQGVCVAACAAGETDCDNACVDLAQDNVLHCGSCDNNCGDNSVCTADSCNAGTCSNVSGATICNDDNPCTLDMCDPQKACTFTPYTQSEFEGLCQQLEGLDPANGCVWCNPNKERTPCDFSPATAACLASPPSAVTTNCGTCESNNGTFSCNTALPQICMP